MLDMTCIDVRSAGASQHAKSPPAKCLDSHALFEGAREIRIDHGGQEYRLRQTRNGKLVLTK